MNPFLEQGYARQVAFERDVVGVEFVYDFDDFVLLRAAAAKDGLIICLK